MICDKPVTHTHAQACDLAARVGVVAQFDNLDVHFTVAENLIAYGRYFGLRTAVFRAGCLTGPAHAGTELHGFLAYLVRCAVSITA